MPPPIPVERLRAGLRAWSQFAGDDIEIEIEPIPPGATADVFLVTRGADRWVAKFAYATRDYFEAGMRVAALFDGRRGFDVSTPLLTAAGDYTVMVEWPEQQAHPLAVMPFVEGLPIPSFDDPGAIELVGDVCGRVHALLIDVDPDTVGVPRRWSPAPEVDDTWDLGEHAWLNDVYRDLAAVAAEKDPNLRHSVGVWDGPDIRLADDRIGLIDFGHTWWYPLVHVVASRALVTAYDDRGRLDRFLHAVERHLPLSEAEHDALDVYRLVNATIYARWAASHPSPDVDEWLERLVACLRADLPRVGL